MRLIERVCSLLKYHILILHLIKRIVCSFLEFLLIFRILSSHIMEGRLLQMMWQGGLIHCWILQNATLNLQFYLSGRYFTRSTAILWRFHENIFDTVVRLSLDVTCGKKKSVMFVVCVMCHKCPFPFDSFLELQSGVSRRLYHCQLRIKIPSFQDQMNPVLLICDFMYCMIANMESRRNSTQLIACDFRQKLRMISMSYQR